MKTTLTILLATWLVLAGSVQAETMNFTEAGFSIKPLDGHPGSAGSQALTMKLPAVNGFAANVNVQIQPYPGTMQDYLALSEAQFSQMGLTLISKQLKGNELLIEYAGTLQGNELHFYAKAIKVNGLFYLATATDSESHWATSSVKLKPVIDSFVAH